MNDIPSNPVDVRLLGPSTVSTLAKSPANDLHEPKPAGGIGRRIEMRERDARQFRERRHDPNIRAARQSPPSSARHRNHLNSCA
jgi:hypothetical protein